MLQSARQNIHGQGELRRSQFTLGRLASLLLRAAVGSAVLALVLCGFAAFAQTAHFSGFETALATTALNKPAAVAVDTGGNIYIADTGNGRILKETPAASGYTESVVASNGLGGPGGVAVDANGNVYVADTWNNRVLKETLSSGSYAQSVVASSGLNSPDGVAVDATGNVYIADLYNNRILKETLSGGTYAESVLPTSPLSGAGSVAVDAGGNVYVVDLWNGRVLKETPSGSTYTESLVSSGGLYFPQGVAVDSAGNVYIADTNDNRVVKETYSAGNYTESVAVTSSLNQPYGVAVDGAGNLYVADTYNSRVLEETQSGDFGKVGIGNTSPAWAAFFTFDAAETLSGISVLTQGEAKADFADAGTGSCTANAFSAGNTCTVNLTFSPKFPWARSGAVALLNGSGNAIATAFMTGAGSGPQVNFLPNIENVIPSSGLSSPAGVAIDGGGNVYIADLYNNRVLKETLSGGTYTESVLPTSPLSGAGAVAVDGYGNIYVADVYNGRILKETPNAGGYAETQVPSSGLWFPQGVAADANGNIYIADTQNNRILKETFSAGSYTESNVTTSTLSAPTAIAADAAGNLYIADTGNNRVLKETLSAGAYSESIVASSANVKAPGGVAVDGAGNVYIADAGNNRLLKEALSDGTYVASTPITSALNYPQGIAIDASGKLYVADAGDNRIVNEDFTAPQSLSFADTTVGSTSNAQTITVENTGNAALSFTAPATGSNPAVSNNFAVNSTGASACPTVSAGAQTASTLAAGASCQFAVAFTPGTAASLSGTLIVTDDNLNAAAPGYASQTVTLSGSGTPAPVNPILTIDQASLNFGEVTENTSSTLTLKLTSTGTSPVTVSGAPVTGAGFTVSGVTFPLSLNPNQSATLQVQFEPTSLGAAQGQIVIGSDSTAGSPVNVGLSGTGIAPIPPSFSIGSMTVNVTAGVTSNHTITITPAGGFTGSVQLTAAVTASPSGAQNLPLFTFGPTSPVSIAGANPASATLSIITTSASTAANHTHRGLWYRGGGAVLACLLLFGIPAQRRKWRTLLVPLLVLVALCGGMTACGGTNTPVATGNGSNAGTAPGTYTVTITGVSGNLTETGTIALTVQ